MYIYQKVLHMLTAAKWIIVLLAMLNFGFMAFDGTRAFVKGDYIRPTSGDYAGRLGPWSGLVASIGIDPESGLMKGIFVVLGVVGLICTLAFATSATWSLNALLIMNVCSLWYLMPGTISSLIQIALLFYIRKSR